MRRLVRIFSVVMLLTLVLSGCGTVTYVLQQYGGKPRPADAIAIVRITPNEPLHVSTIDGEALDVRLASDTRVHVEVLPGVHTVEVYRPEAEVPIAQRVRFKAEAGRTYRVVLARTPPSSPTPWAGRVYEIDPGSGALLRDVTVARR